MKRRRRRYSTNQVLRMLRDMLRRARHNAIESDLLNGA